jgi:hypothetical protein
MKMNDRKGSGITSVLLIGALMWLGMGPLSGCTQHEHHAVSTYEQQPAPEPAPEPEERVVEEGEYRMVSPGEMVVEP